MRILPAISVGIVLSACSDLGPAFQRPEAELPQAYSFVAPVSAPSREDVEWWHSFNDPMLSRLVSEGQKGNLSVAQAQARLREAEAQARAAGVPLSGDATIDLSDRSRSSGRGDVGLTARFNLAGRERARARAAQARLEAARDDKLEARRTVLSQLTIAYIDLRFFQATLVQRQKDKRSRERTLSDIKALLEAGEATKLDLLRARSLLAETRAEIPRVSASIIQQRNRISTLLGVPVGALGLDMGSTSGQPLPSGDYVAGVPADLIRARPDIRSAERLYEAAVADVGAARAARYPDLRLTGTFSVPLNGVSPVQSLLAGLVLPAFSQPALEAEEDAAQHRVNQAYLQWRIAVLNAVEEVENAQTTLVTTRAAARAAKEALALNQESLTVSRDLLEGQGNITVLDVLDRERAVSAARTTVAQNLRDLAVGYVQLRVALGQGHPFGVAPEKSLTGPDSTLPEVNVTRNAVATSALGLARASDDLK